MKLPSEAELIEIERAALQLPSIAAHLARSADNHYDRADRADDADEIRLENRKAMIASAQSAACDALYPRIQQLIELCRAGVLTQK